LKTGEVDGVGLKGDIDLALERLAQARLDSILFRLGQYRCGRDGHLLGAFGLIDELGEGLGNVGKKPDTILFHQLPEKRLSDRRAAETAPEFGQDADLFLYAKGRRGHDMAKGKRLLDSLTQAIEGTPRRFDIRLIEKLEECLGVTSRNCCLYHCPDPLIGN
jgi:hypothetical protein